MSGPFASSRSGSGRSSNRGHSRPSWDSAAEWKVRASTPSTPNVRRRDFSSWAAFSVNVTASISPGRNAPPATWQAMRRVIVVVFPVPAPARMTTGPRTAEAASRCAGFSPSRMDSGTVTAEGCYRVGVTRPRRTAVLSGSLGRPSRAKAPERTGQAELGEQGFDVLQRPATPRRVQAVAVPSPGQFPSLFQREQGALRDAPGIGPPVHVLLRPEEQHGRSVEPDVVPPVGGGDGEVDHTLRREQRAVADRQGHRGLAVSAPRGDLTIVTEHRGDAQGVPD